MDEIAKGLAQNYYAQALSIVVAAGTAAWYIWASRRLLFKFLAFFWNFFAPKIWIPISTSQKQAILSFKHPSYFFALMIRHFIALFWIGVVWLVISNMIDILNTLPKENKNESLEPTLLALRNVMSLVFGLRLGEVGFLTKRVMRITEEPVE